MHGGTEVDLHRSAVIIIGGISVIVASVPIQALDTTLFESHGLMLHDFHILVVKSSIHYRAAFQSVAERMLPVICPAALPGGPYELTYRKLRRPIWPLDEIADRHIREN